MKFRICLLAAVMAACPALAMRDEQPPGAPEADATSVSVAPDASAMVVQSECNCMPAGTTVELEIDQLLNSATQKRGDRFGIRLHAPLIRDGVVLVPAGTAGSGEIIHADRSRGGGKPGELLIAARYLDFEGTRIPLRGLKFGGQGKDNTKVALGTAMAIGPFAHFIRGREIEIPAGTVVSAKLGQDFPTHAASIPESSSEAAPAASSTAAPSASTNKE